jgi:Tfp pilus assembly protein PilF
MLVFAKKAIIWSFLFTGPGGWSSILPTSTHNLLLNQDSNHGVIPASPPSSAADFNALGVLLARDGDLNAAIRNFRQAIALDPKFCASFNNLGVALKDDGQIGAAVPQFQHGLDCQPASIPTLLNLCQAQRLNDAIADSIGCYRRLLAADRNSLEGHIGMGIALRRNDRLPESLGQLKSAVMLDPKSAAAHYQLAETLRQAGKPDAALSEYKVAAALDPRNVEYSLQLGTALNGSSDSSAAEVLRRAVTLDPGSSAAWISLGTVLRRMGQNSEAADAFKHARDIAAAETAKDEAHLTLKQGMTQLNKGELDSALSSLRRVIEIDSQLAEGHEYLAVALTSKGDPVLANQEFETAIGIAPDNAEIRYNYGVALQREARHGDAIAQFEVATSLKPLYGRAHCSLAKSLRAVGNQDRADIELHEAKNLGDCPDSSQ